jgi:hypothetical protein
MTAAESSDDPLQMFDGVWVSIFPPGPHIVFNRIGSQSREASLPMLGQAAVTSSRGESGSNFQISGSGFSCFYLILTAGQRSKMIWELKSGDSVCFPSAVFERADESAPAGTPPKPSPPPDAAPSPGGSANQNTGSPAPTAFLQRISASRWCTSRRSYTLQLAGDSIVWKDSFGSIDMERIIYNNAAGAQTVTEKSIHADGSGVPAGTIWTYGSNGFDRIDVSRRGGNGFSLTRC